MELDELERVVDEVAAMGSFSLSDPMSIKTLQRVGHKLEAITIRAVLSFENSAEWAPDGARNSVAWMATQCHLPSIEGKKQLRRGRMLEKSPVVADAFAAGEIGTAQVDVLARARRSAEVLFERDEELLVEQAKTLKFGPFTTAVAYWTQLADPDGAEESELERAARRDAYLIPSLSGMYLGKMTLDPFSGTIVASELERLEKILFEADWAEAKARLGHDPKLSDLRRTPAQRRADALVEMATRSKMAPADGQRPEPLFTVLVDFPTLYGRICQLEGGPVVSPGSLIHHMDGAWFERVVFAPRARIECSVVSRFFTGATRRAIELRDLECTNPYCDIPAEDCQIDHIVPYAQGGPTTQENGRVLCGFHNRLRNGREPPGG